MLQLCTAVGPFVTPYENVCHLQACYILLAWRSVSERHLPSLQGIFWKRGHTRHTNSVLAYCLKRQNVQTHWKAGHIPSNQTSFGWFISLDSTMSFLPDLFLGRHISRFTKLESLQLRVVLGFILPYIVFWSSEAFRSECWLTAMAFWLNGTGIY